MHFKRYNIAAAALFAVLTVAAAQQPNKCNEKFYGNKSGSEVKMGDEAMPAGVRDPVPRINPNECPKNTIHLGSNVRACDFDVEPYVKMESLTKGEVHRNGDLAHPGVIYVSLFCA